MCEPPAAARSAPQAGCGVGSCVRLVARAVQSVAQRGDSLLGLNLGLNRSVLANMNGAAEGSHVWVYPNVALPTTLPRSPSEMLLSRSGQTTVQDLARRHHHGRRRINTSRREAFRFSPCPEATSHCQQG